MHRLLCLGLFCLGLLGLAAVPAYGQGAPGVPASVVGVLSAAYGRYDPARRCWMASVRDSNGALAACLSVARVDTVPAPDGARRYVILAGAGPQDCHACGGLLAFAAVGPGDRVLAHSAAVRDGAFGQPTDPGRIKLQQLGAADWGWVEESGYTAQGETESHYTIWLLRGTTVTQAGTLTGSHDNQGECGPGVSTGQACYDVKVSYQAVASNPTAAHYPIAMHVSGSKGGRRLNFDAVALYDAARDQYVDPPKMP